MALGIVNGQPRTAAIEFSGSSEMENTAKLIRRLFFPANQYLYSGSLQQERDAVISVTLATYLPFPHGRLHRPTSWNSTFLTGKRKPRPCQLQQSFYRISIQIQMSPYITRNHLFKIPKSDIDPRTTTMRITSVLSVFITNTPSRIVH